MNRKHYTKSYGALGRSLRSRECGLYEAADILLGESLSQSQTQFNGLQLKSQKRKVRIKSIENYNNLLNLIQILMICITNLLTTFTQIGHLLFMMFVSMTLLNGTVEETMMQMGEDSMSNFTNQSFLITEYTTRITLKKKKLTTTHCCYCLYHSLMSHSWWVKVNQQKKPLTAIFQRLKIIMRVFRECLKQSQKLRKLMKQERRKATQ